MIRKIIEILIVLLIILFFWFFIMPGSITPEGYFDDTFLEYEKKYANTSKYTSNCDRVEIMLVAYNYRKKKNYKKCKEWISKANICTSLDLEYNENFLLDTTEQCRQKNSTL